MHEEVIQQSSQKVVTMVQRLYYFGNYVGALCVDVNYERIASQFDSTYTDDSISFLCVLGEDGSLLYNSSKSGLFFLTESDDLTLFREKTETLNGSGVQKVTLGGRQYLLTATRNGKTGWILVQYASMDALNQGIKNLIAVFIVVLSLAMLFSVLVSRQITTLKTGDRRYPFDRGGASEPISNSIPHPKN